MILTKKRDDIMTKGIYLFFDNKYQQVIYAGRFTGRKRIKDHFSPSNKHKQKINEYIQKHEDRIESIIFCEFDDISNNDLNQLEKETIKLFKLNKYKHPDNFVFNFTDGGDGINGYVISKETKKKLSECQTGEKNHNWNKYGEKNPNYGNPSNYKHSEETIEKLSESHLKKYARIVRNGKIKGKQSYSIKYKGEVYSSSTDKKRLYKKWYSKYPNIELFDETI